MKLSEHFTKHEFERSSTAARLSIENIIPEELLPNAVSLCKNVLEPIRQVKGRLIVDSGYRCLELNREIHSGDTSQHVKAEAADIIHDILTPYEICVWIRDNPDIQFDQLIYEGHWTHVSYGPRMRNQCLTAIFKKGEKTKYVPGINKI